MAEEARSEPGGSNKRLGAICGLALVLSGCGFSGALYLPEEPQAAPEEQSSPPPPRAPKQPRPAPEEPPQPGGGDPPEGPPA